MSKKRKITLILLPWSIIIVTLVIAFYLNIWKDLTSGRFHRKAVEMFEPNDKITKVIIYKLVGTENEHKGKFFPIKPYNKEAKVYGKVELTDKELDDFLEVWEYLPVSYYNQASCHNPGYGFRLYEGNSLFAQTSICWECSNFYVKVYNEASWYGFETNSPNSKSLLSFCKKILPITEKKVEQDN